MLETLSDHAFIAAIALLLHALFAGPRRMFAGRWIERLWEMQAGFIHYLERKLNRERRSADERRMRGGAVAVVVLLLALLEGLFFAWLASVLYFGPALEILLVALCLRLRPAADRALEVHAHLATGDIAAARQALFGTVWRHHALLDEHALARAAAEKVAVDFADYTICPLFWYVLLGLPGLFVSTALALLAENLSGHKEHFGYAVYVVDKWVHLLPGRLAAFLLAIAAAFLPFSHIKEALAAAMASSWNWPSRLSVIATTAYALKFTLGGPGDPYLDPPAWLGSGSARLLPRDIIRAIILISVASSCLLLGLLVLG